MQSKRSERLLNARDVADILGVSDGTLANWRSLGIGPSYVRAGSAVRYRAGDVTEWLHQRTVTTSDRPKSGGTSVSTE